MPIKKNIYGDRCEFLISGRVDGELANQLEEAVLNALRSNAKQIFINLAEVSFLCSAGLRVLLQYWRQMKKDGKLLQVVSPSSEADSVLTMSGFREMIVEGTQPK